MDTVFAITCPIDCLIGSLIVNGLVIINSSINPFIFLYFNNQIRDDVVGLFKKKPSLHTTIIVSVASTKFKSTIPS